MLRFYNKAGRKWLSCLSIVLLLMSMFPTAALALGSTNEVVIAITNDVLRSDLNLNASDISEHETSIDFTLTSNDWNLNISQNGTVAGPIFTNVYPTLKGCFTTTGNATQWGTLLDSATFKMTDIDTITMTIPQQPYDIQDDQIVTFTPKASLLQDLDIVSATQPSFNIKADYATISGTLTTGATQSKIISGGETLIITLNNCTWANTELDMNDKTKAFKAELFASLESSVGNALEWAKVIGALNLVDNPIKINDNKTLTITLPAVPDYNGYVSQTVIISSINKDLLSAYTVPLANIINGSFTISPDTATTTVRWSQSPVLTESLIVNQTLTMTLSNNTWPSDIASSSARKKALLAGFTTSTDIAAWDNVKAAILASGTFVVDSTTKTLTITIPPPIAGTDVYKILTNQTINVNVPSTVLENNYTVSPNPLSFTITANPSVAITGTLTAGVNELDIVKGGKDIVATLYNATWKPSVTTDRVMRESLIDYLLSSTSVWSTSDMATIKAGATYTLTNSNTVTITLPPVPEFNIDILSPMTITPVTASLKSLTNVPLSPVFDNASNLPFFTINPISNQSASISGTVTTATESDIVTGGKTLVITLNNDVWAQNVVSNSALLGFISNGIPVWTLSPTDVVRTNDTVLTITLPPVTAFDANDSDQTIQVNIPSIALLNSIDQIDAGSFTVKAVTATLSGTAVTSSLNSTSVLTGGKTIVITLKDATWASDVITAPAKLIALKACFTSNVPISDPSNWRNINNLITAQNITLSSKNVLTIKLPPVASYTEITGGERVTFNLSSATLPNLVNEKLGSNRTLTSIPIVQIGQAAQSVVTADLSGNMSVSAVVNGGQMITITLTNGSWDPLLPTTSAKISTLVSGFTADSDSTSWAMVQTALKSASLITNHSFVLSTSTRINSSPNDTLTIRMPAVPGYDPVKSQKISLTIPKTVLVPATANVIALGSIQINLPLYTSKGTLKSLLDSGSFATYISTVPLQDLFLKVPTKFLTSVVSKQSTIGNTTVNSLDIYTDLKVTSVKVYVNGKDYVSSTFTSSGSGKRFNVGFATVNSTTADTLSPDAIISVLEGTTDLQSQTTIKMAASKTYSMASTTDLSGSYSLYKLMNNTSLLTNILKYYVPADITLETR